jgi:hypothetical protein
MQCLAAVALINSKALAACSCINSCIFHQCCILLPFHFLLQVRAREPFTPGMLQEVEQFYFGSYMAHFAEPAFAAALAAIPFTFSWDGKHCSQHPLNPWGTAGPKGWLAEAGELFAIMLVLYNWCCVVGAVCRVFLLCWLRTMGSSESVSQVLCWSCQEGNLVLALLLLLLQTMTSLMAGAATRTTCSAAQSSRACLLWRGVSTCCSNSTAATTTPQPSAPRWENTATTRCGTIACI